MIATTGTYSLRSFTPGAPPSSFSFDFTFQQTSEILAVLYGPGLAGAPLTLGVDYTVATSPPAASGTINVIGSNWAGAYAAYGNIRIYRKTAIVNGTSVVNGGAIDANVLEFVVDELTQMMQEQGAGGIAAIFDLQAPVTDPPGLNYILPAASVRAGTGLLFDANGNVVAGSPSAATINAAWQAALAQGTVSGLLSGLGALIIVNTSASNTPAALNGSYFYNVGAAGATSQNFTAGATVAGMTLGVYNSGAGACSVVLSGSVTISLIQGQYLSVVWNGTAWEVASNVLPTIAAPSTTPFTLSANDPRRIFLITTGASAFVFNLPTAASMLGQAPITIIKVDSGAGAVQIVPSGGDLLAQAGNVSCYLGAQWQSLTLEATASGQWSVLGGTFAPHQTVDTDGSQLGLGKLHHLPLGNTTSRSIFSSAPPAAAAWSAAQTGSGVVGVPTGAKGIRVALWYDAYSTAAGMVLARMFFSDNNSNIPSLSTGHPRMGFQGYSDAAAHFVSDGGKEVDIPLNSSGQFYIYSLTQNNITIANSALYMTVVGWWDGL